MPSPFSKDSEKSKKQPEEYFESNAGDGTRVEDQQLKGIALFLTLFSALCALFLSALDQTIVTTILSIVGNKFHDFEKIGWLTSGYLLPMASLTPSYGKISIAFGRKNVLLAGIFVFEVGSLISALANSMDMLIGGRVIQGIGGGAISSMVSVILTESVHISKRSLVFSLIGVTFALASVLGPFIGGAFASHVSWRWCFYVNLPIGGAAATMLFFSFNPPKPKGNFKEKLAKIDYLGTFLIAAGLVLILLALTWGGTQFPWKSAAVILCFILGGLLLVSFTVWNFVFSKHPIVLKHVFTNYKVVAAWLSGTFSFAMMVCLMTYLAVYFQVIWNASAWKSGILTLPMVIPITIASISSGFLIKGFGMPKPVMVVSGVLAPIGAGILLLLGVNSSSGDKIGLLIVVGVSIGLQFQGAMLSSQLEAPREVEGSIIMVTVFLNFVRSIGAAISVTVGQVIYQTSGAKNLNNLIAKLPKDSKSYQELIKVPVSAYILSPELIQKFDPETKKMVLEQIMSAIHDIFYFCLALACLALIACVFTTNRRLPKSNSVRKTDESKEGEDEVKEEGKEDEEKGSEELIIESDVPESWENKKNSLDA